MKISGRLALVGISCVAFIGCAHQNKAKPEAKKAPPPPKLVGVVMSKNSQKNYVLIEYYGTWKFDQGTELTTVADRRSAVLMTSGEKLGPYIAADVESGIVDVGDAVYYKDRVNGTAEEIPDVDETVTPSSPTNDTSEGVRETEIN